MFRYGYFVVIFSDKVSFKESLGSSCTYTYKHARSQTPCFVKILHLLII